MGRVQYKAFISYSHQDRDWSAWLQRALEAYRVPRRLVGTKGEFGEVPRRLTPVFRDREDLSSASDLTAKVKDSLESAESLVVICSPAAAQSNWVNEEIDYFKSLGRESRIFALIVDGDPQPSDPEQQCFPSALIRNQDGSVREPLAADARKWADGKLLAKLKIIAGILGIRLDELRRRNMQRRRRNLAIGAVSTLVMLVLTGTLLFTTISSQKEARMQRSNTEELLSYMLGNLKRLEPIVGLEVLSQEDEQVKKYLASLGFDGMKSDQLIEQGMAWREQGQSAQNRGQFDEAMEYFQRSRAAFIQNHQREGNTTQSLFELGQAEFWVGYVHFDKGDFDDANESFLRYGAITRRLVNADPNDAKMIMELAYTLTNLGELERVRSNSDAEKALRLMQSSVQYKQIALVLDPGNDAYRKDLIRSLAFLADAWMESCDLGKAIDFRQQAVQLARDLYASEPDNLDVKLELAFSLSGLASVQRRIPIPDQALANLRESRDLLEQLSIQDGGNPSLHWRAFIREVRMLQIRMWYEPPADLWPEFRGASEKMQNLKQEKKVVDFDSSMDSAQFLLHFSLMAQKLGHHSEVEWALDALMDQLTLLVREKPKNRLGRQFLARAWWEYWARNGVLPNEQAASALENYLANPKKATSCNDAGLAARLEIMRGNTSLASDYTLYLLEKGYFEPEFVTFCREYNLCD
jgi:tetratricopeptide (TPR) repeat protein